MSPTTVREKKTTSIGTRLVLRQLNTTVPRIVAVPQLRAVRKESMQQIHVPGGIDAANPHPRRMSRGPRRVCGNLFSSIPISLQDLQHVHVDLILDRIAILVPELFLEAQFHPLTFKMAVLVLKLYFQAQFHLRTIKMIVLVLKLCILGSVSSIKYQKCISVFKLLFSTQFYLSKKNYMLGTISSMNYQNAFWHNFVLCPAAPTI